MLQIDILSEIEDSAIRLAVEKRRINQLCARLDGVAATVPPGTSAIRQHLAGKRVILRDVHYDQDLQAILATVTDGREEWKLNINERWFK